MKQQKEKLFKRIRNKAMAFLAVLGLSIGGAEGTGLLPEYGLHDDGTECHRPR